MGVRGGGERKRARERERGGGGGRARALHPTTTPPPLPSPTLTRQARHVGDVVDRDVVFVTPIHGQQVAFHARVLARERPHRHARVALVDRQAGRPVFDAQGRPCRARQEGFRPGGVGVLPQVKHDDPGGGVG